MHTLLFAPHEESPPLQMLSPLSSRQSKSIVDISSTFGSWLLVSASRIAAASTEAQQATSSELPRVGARTRKHITWQCG